MGVGDKKEDKGSYFDQTEYFIFDLPFIVNILLLLDSLIQLKSLYSNLSKYLALLMNQIYNSILRTILTQNMLTFRKPFKPSN